MPQTINATIFFTLGSFFQKRLSENFRLLFIHHLRTHLGTQKCKTCLYQSLNATNCLTNHPMKHWGDGRLLKSQVLSSVCASPCKCCLCSVELRIHVIRMHKAKTIRNSSQISGYRQCFLKLSSLSGNFLFYPGTCLEILQTVQKSSKLSGNLPGCPEIF